MKLYHSMGQFWYSIFMIAVSFILLAGFTVGFVQHAIDENNQKFCTVLITLTQPKVSDPTAEPKTEYGKQQQEFNEEIARELRELSQKYKCHTTLKESK